MFMNYVGTKAEARTAGATGTGVFAVEPIAKGETVVVFGGFAVTRPELDDLPGARRAHSLQIDDDLFLVGPGNEPGDFVNHSCEPNLGVFGSVMLVARRDIAEGEELTYDYAMTDSQDYDEFVCLCGTPSCRGVVTGSDWLRPDLQRRYRGSFSAYLARRIGRLAGLDASRRVFALDDHGAIKGIRPQVREVVAV